MPLRTPAAQHPYGSAVLGVPDATARSTGCPASVTAWPEPGPAGQRIRPAVQADQAGRAAGAAAEVLRVADRDHRWAAGPGMGDICLGGQFMVAAGSRRFPGDHVRSGWLSRS